MQRLAEVGKARDESGPETPVSPERRQSASGTSSESDFRGPSRTLEGSAMAGVLHGNVFVDLTVFYRFRGCISRCTTSVR